jgi:hypothetical protein
MSRAIRRGEASFLNALLKLIPSEVVAVYLFVLGILPGRLVPHLTVAALLVALTPLYLRFAMGVRSAAQLAVSSVSMLIWIYALGQGPVRFLAPPWYEPWYGSVALALWTLIPPMFLYREAGETQGEPPKAEAGKEEAGKTGAGKAGAGIRSGPGAKR